MARSLKDRGGRTYRMAPILLAAMVAGLVGTARPALADDGIPIDAPVRFEGGQDTLLELGDGRRFHDTIELPARSGLVVNEVSMEHYVLGIAEMPSRWPIEALKAQAVAARTYAWHVMRRGVYSGYDICATVACQVFRGADTVLEAAAGERWQAAVQATAGEVLVDGNGAPVLARYFSTSGGATYANEEVFRSEGPHPHLVGIDDPYDAASPLHRWEVVFTREEFEQIIARGSTLHAAVPIAEVERLGDVRDQRADLRFTGEDGTQVVVSAIAVRDFLSSLAPRMFPDRFPPLRSDGERPLPSTLPSTRFTIEVGEDAVVVEGQGWGHGVGMGQYGALGRAEAGAGHRDILAAYYNGLEPAENPDLPERIRVGLDLGAGSTSVRAHDVVRIVAGGEVVVERALGSWAVERDDTDWRLVAPPGHGDPLEVSATAGGAVLDERTRSVVIEADVNKPVLLRLEVEDDQGDQVLVRDLGVRDAGRHVTSWRLDDGEGRRVSAGTYRVALVAEDADGTVAGEPTDVQVPDPPSPRNDQPPSEAAPDAVPGAPVDDREPAALVVWLLAGIVLLVVVASAAYVGRRRVRAGAGARRGRTRRRRARHRKTRRRS